VSSGVTANQNSTDIGSSATISQSAATGQASGRTSAQASTGTTQADSSAQGSASGEVHHGKARGHDEERLTGLDRADQVAGEHGQHGRDNARERQGG
jgi:hypothetical protein